MIYAHLQGNIGLNLKRVVTFQDKLVELISRIVTEYLNP